MKAHPRYDAAYWQLIGNILASNDIRDGKLVDIGANVGDTICYFRGFSQGPVWGIEPDQRFFTYLRRNTNQFADVKLTRALLAPHSDAGKVRLATAHGTGSSTPTAENDAYSGRYLSGAQVMNWVDDSTVLKSDTDGFDGRIVSELAAIMGNRGVVPAIVAFEGPTLAQTKAGQNAEHIEALRRLQHLGYRVHVLTNIGESLATLGDNHESARLLMEMHRLQIDSDDRVCPYFDFICVAPTLRVDVLLSTGATQGA